MEKLVEKSKTQTQTRGLLLLYCPESVGPTWREKMNRNQQGKGKAPRERFMYHTRDITSHHQIKVDPWEEGHICSGQVGNHVRSFMFMSENAHWQWTTCVPL